MPGASSPLIWALIVLSFIPGIVLYWGDKGRARVGHKPLVAAALILGFGILAASAFVAESNFAQGIKVLDFAAFGLGAVVVTLGTLLHEWSKEDSSGDAAVGAIGGATLLLLTGQEGALAALTAFSAILGMAAAGCIWAALGYRRVAVQALVGAGLFTVGAGLCGFREDPSSKQVPGSVGLVIAGSSVLATVLSVFRDKVKGFEGPVALAIFIAASAALSILSPNSEPGSAGILLMITGFAAAVATYGFPEDSKHKGVSAILWLGAATYGFATLQGLGVAVVALGAVSSLLLAKRSDLLAGAAPLAGFAVYRLFLEGAEGTAKAFDIGQHYAMIGLLVGFMGVQAVWSFVEELVVDCKIPLTKAVIAAVFLGALLLGGGLILQDKGIVGIILGSSMAAAVMMDRGRWPSLAVLGTGFSAAAFTAVAFKALQPSLALTRDAKQMALIIFVVIAAVCAAALVMLARPKTEGAHAQ